MPAARTRRSVFRPRPVIPALLLAATWSAGCGTWQRVGEESAPRPADQVPQLFDPSRAYREMGLLADAGPLGFIGTVRVVAGPTPDTLLLAVGVSLRNRGLTFRRDGDQFVAEYRIEIVLRGGAGAPISVARDERVRVGSFRETQRGDESVIFQDFVTAGPGSYALSVTVRDRNSPNGGRAEAPISVPALRSPAVSLPMTVYQARGRSTLTERPELVMNPRQSVDYGADSLLFYVETYGLTAGSRFELLAIDGAGRTAWSDTVAAEAGPVRGVVRGIPPARLSIGRYELRLVQNEVVMAATPFLVTFSDQYAVANMEDIVSLLRYFGHEDSLRALVRAPPEQRGAMWQRFFRSSDPNPATPENEAIDEYLQRVRLANERFTDEGSQGWLTERGEVFIALGEPSEILDRRQDQIGRGRYIVWNYYEVRLALTFIDDTGFGRLRLDPRSRAEFQRVRNQLRNR